MLPPEGGVALPEGSAVARQLDHAGESLPGSMVPGAVARHSIVATPGEVRPCYLGRRDVGRAEEPVVEQQRVDSVELAHLHGVAPK